MVVITTHSDLNTGDLHIAPNNTGSVPADEVSFYPFLLWDCSKLLPALRVIFPERFCNILQRDKENILNLLSFGALSSRPESREAVKTFASKYIFQLVI